MPIDTEMLIQLIQFGFAGIALFMMYSITYNHLERIEQLLEQIRSILSKG